MATDGTHLRIDVHPLPLYAGGELETVDVGGERRIRLGPGGEWAERFAAAGESADATVALTTRRNPGDDGGRRTPRPYAVDGYDVVVEDDMFGNLSRTAVYDVLAQGVAAAEPTDAAVDDEVSAALDDLTPGRDDDLDAFDRDRVLDAYVDLIGEVAPETVERLAPETVAALRPERVAEHVEGLLGALDGSADGGRVGDLRDDWRLAAPTAVGEAHRETVAPVAESVETVEFGGGTFTKCQNGVVSNVLGTTDDVRARIDLDTTFVDDDRRVHDALSEPGLLGLEVEALDPDDRTWAERLLARPPPSVAALDRGADAPFRAIAEQVDAYRERPDVDLDGDPAEVVDRGAERSTGESPARGR